MGKEVGKEWNSRFIAFIPFLCGLTSELALALTTLCEMESNQELLFQQTKEDIVKVLLLQLYCCLVRLILCINLYLLCRQWKAWVYHGKVWRQRQLSLLSAFIRSSRKSKYTTSFIFLNFGTCAIHAYCVTLFRSLASVDRLALQESYFDKLHNVAPYFVILCFERLKTVYISPLQLKYDIEFFYACTVIQIPFPLRYKPF